MRKLQKPLKNLINLNHFLTSKFGSGLFTVLGIMAFLLVGCGLFVGMLGHGWGGAWFLVLLGLLSGILPTVHLYETTFPDSPSETESVESPVPPTFSRPRPSLDDASKKAIELEAALARRRILERENERKQKLREEQEAREREMAKIAAQRYAEEQKRLRVARMRDFEHRERQERQQKNFNQNYFRQDQFRKSASVSPEKSCLSSEFFQGIHTSAELKKRYLDLLKIYHPDNATGDVRITQKLQSEYQQLSQLFENFEQHRIN